MIPSILLPRYFKWIGLLLAVAGYAGAFMYHADFDDVTHPQGLLIQVAVLAGFLFIAGARERTEDEWIRHIRLTSLQWSVAVLIVLRVAFKSVAFYKQDTNWLPGIEVNGLLLIYLVLFYYQLYVMEHVLKLFKGSAK